MGYTCWETFLNQQQERSAVVDLFVAGCFFVPEEMMCVMVPADVPLIFSLFPGTQKQK